MIISFVKGTFNDMIGKEHILTAVKAKLIPRTSGETGAEWATDSDSIGETGVSTPTDAHPGKSVRPENTCILPLAFQLFLCIALQKGHTHYLIFRTLALTFPTTAVLDKIS